MAGITYPDLAGSLGAAMQIRSQAQRNALEAAREERILKQEADDERAQTYLPAALQGDKAAIANLPPRWAIQLAPMLEKLDTAQRQKVRDAYEWQGNTALGILNTPEADRQKALDAAHQEAEALGYGPHLKNFPTQYTPGVAGLLQFHANRSKEGLKLLEGMPVPMGPVGGGVAPGAAPGRELTPQALQTGRGFVNRLTAQGFSPAAAAGVVGGLFQESGFNPSAVGDNGSAIGLGQWRLDRAHGLQTFAQQQGKSPADPNVQLDYLVNEMKSGDMGAQRAYAMLQTAKTPEEATMAMMHFFRPAGYTPNNPQGGHGYADRVQYSNQFLPANGPPQSVPGAPQVAQGDAIAGQGDVMAPPRAAGPPLGSEIDEIRKQTRANGGDIFQVKGQPEIKDGHYVIRSLQDPKTVLGMIPIKGKEPPAGYRAVQGGYEPVPGGPADPNTRKPPEGYVNAPGGGYAFVPGGPADPDVIKRNAEVKKTASEKAIPQTVVKGMQENLDALKQVDRALTELSERPGSVGGLGSTLAANLPGVGGLQNRELFGMGDPQGAKLRALIADIGSLKLHDRSGAAVTASEFPRLRPFIPSISDDPETVKTKLMNFKAVYEQTLRDTSDYYNADNGFKAHGPTESYLNGGKPEASAAPKVGDMQDGYVFKGGDPSKPESWGKIK